jgi:hypothetical protein
MDNYINTNIHKYINVVYVKHKLKTNIYKLYIYSSLYKT